MVIALNIKPAKVEITQSDKEWVAEGIKIGLSLPVVLTACVTDKEEALSKSKMDDHVNDEENSHLSEHLNHQSCKVVGTRPDSKVIENVKPHEYNPDGLCGCLEQMSVVYFSIFLVLY